VLAENKSTRVVSSKRQATAAPPRAEEQRLMAQQVDRLLGPLRPANPLGQPQDGNPLKQKRLKGAKTLI
jgi:hypothetical protein